MADINKKLADNVPGAWYVDSECTCCGLCEAYAPSVFRLAEGGGYNYVHHQPTNDRDVQEALRAKESCPVDAIGSDGA